jgi:hypothetical protein
MDLNLGSLIKAGLIMAFILPAFSIVLMTLPTTPPPVLASNNTASSAQLAAEMNSTSLYIQTEFLSTVSGMNASLNGNNGSFSANPTIYTAFAFILNGFGTAMQSIIMIPYIDLVSMNFLAMGTQYALPQVVSGFISVGIKLLYAYTVISLLFLGISMIQKYNAKT